MNEGAVATRAGIRAQPASAESAMVARDIELCALTGARYHVAHVSSADSVRLIREAKRRGLPVTCEVTPHHLTLTDEACARYDTHAKCNPPLRAAADVEALRAALADGTIDAVATDHAPHSPVEKEVEFEQAAFGIIGLETAVPLVLDLVRAKLLTPLGLRDSAVTGAGRAVRAAGRLARRRGARRRDGHRPRGGLDLRAGRDPLALAQHAVRRARAARTGGVDGRRRCYRLLGEKTS